jgi:multidrug efflux pump subunit AcrA (membrane-fusion protein)
VFLGLLTALALIALVFTVRAVFFRTSFQASGTVQSVLSSDLNFAASGPITEIDVRPGDHVKAGQVLAKQDDTVVKARVAADEAVLAADNARLTEVQSPPRPEQATLLQAMVNEAAAKLQSAEADVAAATAAQSSLAGVATAQQQSQAALAAAQAAAKRLAAQCPGVALPAPLPVSLPDPSTLTLSSAPSRRHHHSIVTGSPPTTRPSPTTHPPTTRAPTTASTTLLGDVCRGTAAQLAADTGALTSLRTALQQVVRTGQLGSSAARNTLSEAAAHLAVVKAQQSVGLLPGTAADIADAQAAVDKDTATLAADQQALQQGVVVAPMDGVVAAVGGHIGEVATEAGVHNFAPPQPLSQPSSGFRLFPSAPVVQTGQPLQFSPVVTVHDPSMKVVAQVKESDVGRLPHGHVAHVTLPALHHRRFMARIDRVQPLAGNQSGEVFYLVDVSLDFGSSAPAVLPGMTADVSF